jgi:hypothetical protein
MKTEDNGVDDLDRILLSEESLAPSSGFAAAVMESVREAAAEPPPLAFPWTRFAACAIACVAGAAAGAIVIAGIEPSALREAAAPLQAAAPELGYAAAAAIASLAVVRLPRLRRESRRG